MGRSREEAVRISRPLGKRRLKSVLKQIARDINARSKELIIIGYLVCDLLDDGVINGSILAGLLS